MNIELLVAIFTVVMAVLGGIVSAHAPAKRRQKWMYGAAFLVLGCASVVLVIYQSQATEKARREAQAAQESFNFKVEGLKGQAEQITQALAKMRPLATQQEIKQHALLHNRVANRTKLGDEITEVERLRRTQLLSTLRNYYILSHDGITSEMMAGLEWPPEDWINQQLDRYRENWRVHISTDKRTVTFAELK